jgi:iron complex transport system substrate-binding protein
MRIVSLQPSVTVTLAGLGALDQVVACTRYCKDVCPEIAEGKQIIIEDSWSANSEQIALARPDLVIASVPYRLESLAAILRSGIRVLALSPKSLADVYGDIRTLAALVDGYVAGEKLISGLQDEIAQTREETGRYPRQRVYCEEWGKPMIASQRWVAELVEAAGGIPVGDPGAQTAAAAVATADPEVVLAAWCGAGDRVPLHKLALRERWGETTAVRERRLYCVADELFNTPAHTLVGGLRAIRWALHPDIFRKPLGIRGIGESVPGNLEKALPPKQVVAAVIVRAGKVLICQRTEEQDFALQWEFPGGKVERGEDFATALVRELREELGIEAVAEREIATVRHQYAEGLAVELHFFLMKKFDGEIENKIFREVRWEEREKLDAQSFLEADRDVVRGLKSGELG